MSFPLVHFNSKLVLKTKNGTLYTIYSKYYPPYNAAIDFTYPFAKGNDPSNPTVTIHGLTRRHAKMFKKGGTVAVYAGWCNSDDTQNNYHLIFNEKITGSVTMSNQGGDWQTSFTCTDGRSNNNNSSKSLSRSIRSGASNISELSASERNALNKVRKHYGIKSNNIKSIRSSIASKKASIAQRIHNIIEEAESKNRALAGHRDKAAREAIRAWKLSHENPLKAQRSALINASKDLTIRSKANTKRRSNASRRIRTQYQAKRTRARRSKARLKSKSVKHKNSLHFKKGTRASAIIKNLAERSNIHISKLNLVKDKRYTSGYTADKSPKQCIDDIVADCNSSINWPHGRLEIGHFGSNAPNGFVLTPETGLLTSIQNNDEDDSDSGDDSVTQYSVHCIFLPWVTSGSKFKIVDPISPLNNVPNKEPINVGDQFDDTVVVMNGESEVNSGDTPTTDLTVVKASDEAKAEVEAANSKRRSKVKKVKNRKDARERHKTKVKRHARQVARVNLTPD